MLVHRTARWSQLLHCEMIATASGGMGIKKGRGRNANNAGNAWNASTASNSRPSQLPGYTDSCLRLAVMAFHRRDLRECSKQVRGEEFEQNFRDAGQHCVVWAIDLVWIPYDGSGIISL